MGKKILDSKALYMVLSIVLAFAAWLFVTSKDGTKDSERFANLLVEFSGEEILEERGLMIVNRDVKATITVQAAPTVLAVLKREQPRLVANVANISTEDTHVVNYRVILPNGVKDTDVEIIYSGPGGLGGSAVSVEVAQALSRKVRIEGEFQGTVAEGYLAGDNDDFRFDPVELVVSGRADLVNQVSHVKVIVSGDNLTETVSDAFPFQLIGASGDPLELDVNCDVDTIYTVFPIRATAEIPLKVNVVSGGGLSVSDITLSLSDKSITVAGSKEAVDALAGEGELLLGTIDLAELDDNLAQNGGDVTFAIPLADELENLSGITEVTATIRVNKRVETRTFQVTSRISTINTPEGWTPTIITQVLAVRVRGPEVLLDELTEESIRVVADLKDINQAAGKYTVPATIYLDSAGTLSDVGVVTPRTYSVVVSLVKDG
ncbi:MAG: hypothetical protein HFF23_06240 [Oscillospiraceae bacterium]|jgi:YbbR domain-containing protein|nr:hypothetical protein [Oscillospiraceae bacterium]